MNEIFAHRALYKSQEHSLDGIKNYVESEIGMELDLRYGKNGIYMSHDVSNSAELLKDACEILSKSKCKTVFHIKEMQVIKETIQLLKQYSIKDCVLYSTDGEENILNENILNENFVEVAFYANQFPNNIKEKILWCDEVNEKWFEKSTIMSLHEQGKILYTVSKELLKTANLDDVKMDWNRLIELQFDGICTDLSYEFLEFVKE